MLNKIFTWELDPYGTNPANDIKAERKVLSSTQDGTFMFLIPKAAPFYAETVVIKHVASGRTLVKGVDWEPGYRFELVSKRTYRPVYGAICILDRTLTGTFEYNYHTLGGEYTLDEQSLLTLLSNALTDPRVTTWEKITDVPWYFTPIQHLFNVVDMVGGKELADAINRVADKILSAAERLYPSINVHIQDKANPHNTTKAQVGLGNVSNFSICTEQEALEGVRLDRYISPGHVSKMIAKLNSTSVAGHVSDKENPHGVNKIQVGLGNVDNFTTATDLEAVDKANDATFMTPRKSWLAVKTWVGDTVAAHVANSSNPHGVNKSQIGLSNVQNLGVASEVDAVAGSGNNGLMTPELTKKAIAAQAGASGVQSHIDNHENPHNVTKVQIGLGSVENYKVANQLEAEGATANNVYMTPLAVAYQIAKTVGATLTGHIARTDNPHGTTKTQVGLGNVDNFATATATELEAGTSTSHFVTVAGVVSLIVSRIGTALTDHVNSRTNPHVVTKAQVGLGNVQNFPIGTETEYEAGNSNVHYATVYGVSQMIARLSSGTVAGHLADLNNPHATTKAQVGLGNVDNFGTANQGDLDTGTSTTKFVTPSGVSSMVLRLVGGAITAHVNRTDNPHDTTKAQVGLGAVENYGVATNAEAIDGTATDRYMTPANTKAVVDSLTNGLTTVFDTHVNNTSNPHAVTKAQVGLDAVENYGVATDQEAIDGVINSAYMTPASTKAAVDEAVTTVNASVDGKILTVTQTITTHTERTDNPHGVTKTQVGLGSVVDAGFAVDAELDAGTATELYVSPYGVKRIVDAAIAVISIAKAQVGLGNVDNFPTATNADVITSSSTTFATPATALTAASIVSRASLLPNFVTVSGNVADVGNYRVMAGGVDLTFPDSNEGVVRVIVDHSVDLGAGTVKALAPAGETFDTYNGIDAELSLTATGKEYIFVRYENVWRIS